jgi:hypothetical protein
MGGICSIPGKTKLCYEKLKGCLLGSPKLRWDDNDKTDLTVTECETVDPAHLVRDWNQWRALVKLRGSVRAIILKAMRTGLAGLHSLLVS